MFRIAAITGAVIAGALSTLVLRAKQTRTRAVAAAQLRTRKGAPKVKKSTVRHK